MADFKLSDGKTTHPPDLPLRGTELMFATQYRLGSPVTVIISVSDVAKFVRPKRFDAPSYYLSQI